MTDYKKMKKNDLIKEIERINKENIKYKKENAILNIDNEEMEKEILEMNNKINTMNSKKDYSPSELSKINYYKKRLAAAEKSRNEKCIQRYSNVLKKYLN